MAEHKLTGGRALALAVLSTIFGSTGGPLLLIKFGGPNVFAPDRYTATDASYLERRVISLEDHTKNHPDDLLRAEIADLKARMLAGETEREQIIKNQDRIFNQLDK